MLSNAAISTFESILGKQGVMLQGESLEDYAHDEMTEYGLFTPEAVLLPTTQEQVSAIMHYCNEQLISVTPRGAGTGLCGGCVAAQGGVILSLEKMTRILAIDCENMTARVEPGVLLMSLNAQLLGTGLFYPPDPGEKSATLGGNIMTNAGGMRAVRYGVTRDYVLALTCVMPDGEILQLGGDTVKNASGYSLKDLVIGSEGTLCIVTEILLKLIPEPETNLSLLIPFATLDACIAAVPQVLRSGAEPTAVEFMESAVIRAVEHYLGKAFPDTSAPAYLLIRLDGPSPKALEPQIEQITELMLSLGALDVFLADTEERKSSIWDARGAFLEAIKAGTPSMDECDVVVPRMQIPSFIHNAMAIGKAQEVRICSFGHAGDGNLHIYICQDGLSSGDWRTKRQLVMDALYRKAQDLHGQVSGEHGIGHAKTGYLMDSLGDSPMRIMRGIKAVFDPRGILNPGKVV